MRQVANTIRQWEWLLLLLLLPVLLFPTGPQALLLLILPALWLIRWLATGHFIPPTPYDTALLVLMAMVLVSLTVVFDIELSFPKIAGMTLGVSLFYGVVAYTRQHKDGLWHVLAFYFVAGMGLALAGVVGIEWSGPFSLLNQVKELLPADLRAIPGTVGGAVNPNEMAGVSDWVVPLMVASLIGFWRPLWRRGKYLLFPLLIMNLIVFTMLVGTLSRGGILATAIGFLVMLAISFRWGRVLLIVAGLVAIVLVFYLDVESLVVSGGTAVGQIGLQGRLEIWSRALYGLADFPFTGMSMNGFRRLVHVLYPLFLVSPDTDIGHAHNHLLQAGLDLGIPGLIAYLALWLVSVFLLWRSWRRTSDGSSRVLIVGLAGALTAGWIFGVFDAIALGARPAFMWWILLAMIVGVHDKVSTGHKVPPD